MKKARIYQPARTAMQSGRAKTSAWLLEYTPNRKIIDPVTGWTGGDDTLQQIYMKFNSIDEAIAYAREKNIPYEVEAAHPRQFKKKAYADNFLFNKVETYGTV